LLERAFGILGVVASVELAESALELRGLRSGADRVA
jgi:hypothetical protein